MVLGVLCLLNILIIFLLLMIQLLLYSPIYYGDLNLSPLESGFELIKQSSYLSSSFFLLGVIFVLFDVELLLFIPFILLWKFSWKKTFFLFMTMYFIMFTLFMEWMLFGLKWQS